MKAYRKGATLVEYGIIGALILVFCIAAVTLIGEGLDKVFTGIKGDLTKHTTTARNARGG